MCKSHETRRHKKHGRGPSSFWMQDADTVFTQLNLQPKDCFLDLGCGPGDYSIHAAKAIGEGGLVYALDREEEAFVRIKEKIISEGCSNVTTIKSDFDDPLPISDSCVDVCLMATALHIFQLRRAELSLFKEIHRVLKTGGCLAIIECKKEEQPFGPPKHMRLSPEEVTEAVRDHGFRKVNLTDLGYNYLIQFVAK